MQAQALQQLVGVVPALGGGARHLGQADVVVQEGQLLLIGVVLNDRAEDGFRDSSSVDLHEVDGIPRRVGRSKPEGQRLLREEEDAAQAKVGAGVGVGHRGDGGVEGMDLIRYSAGDRIQAGHQLRERRRRALSAQQGSALVARLRMGARKARPQRPNSAL